MASNLNLLNQMKNTSSPKHLNVTEISPQSAVLIFPLQWLCRMIFLFRACAYGAAVTLPLTTLLFRANSQKSVFRSHSTACNERKSQTVRWSSACLYFRNIQSGTPNKSTCLLWPSAAHSAQLQPRWKDPIRHMRVFLLPPNSHDWLDFGGRLSLLFAVNFCRASSPWIFISPLTPLNVNSSFPVLLFISVAWWFDHAENTRLAIASSLVLPQGHLLLKCYCLCFLTLWTQAPLQFAARLRLSPLRSPSALLGAQQNEKRPFIAVMSHFCGWCI